MRILPALILPALALLAVTAPAAARPVLELEDNNNFVQAQTLDSDFTLFFNPNIGDTTVNTSVVIPNVTVMAGSNPLLGPDFYSFTVATAGSRGIFDVDFAYTRANTAAGSAEESDTFLSLFDAMGTLLAFNADAPPEYGQGGSLDGGFFPIPIDAFLEFTFATPGLYYIAVSGCCDASQPIPYTGFGAGQTQAYQLQVSIQNHAHATPEPAPLALLGLGLAAITLRRRSSPLPAGRGRGWARL